MNLPSKPETYSEFPKIGPTKRVEDYLGVDEFHCSNDIPSAKDGPDQLFRGFSPAQIVAVIGISAMAIVGALKFADCGDVDSTHNQRTTVSPK